MNQAIFIDCQTGADVSEPAILAERATRGNHVVLRFNRLSENEKTIVIARLSEALPDHSIFDSSVAASPTTITIMPVVAAARVVERIEPILLAIADYNRMCSELVKLFQAGMLPREWNAGQHGGHIRFENRKSGQIVEAPFREWVNPNRVDPFFLAKFVKSTPGMEAVAELIEHDFHDAARILDLVAVDKARRIVSLVDRKVLGVNEAAMQLMDLLGDYPSAIYGLYPILPPSVESHLRHLAAMRDEEWYHKWFGSTCGPSCVEAIEIRDSEPRVTFRKRHFDPDRIESYPLYANHPARVAIETLRRYLVTKELEHQS